MPHHRRASVGSADARLPPKARDNDGARTDDGFRSAESSRENAPGSYRPDRKHIWIRPPADSNELYRYVYLFQVNIVSFPLQVCQHVPMDRIEMKTKATNTIIPTGLLVRVWEQGTEPDLRNPLHYRSPVDPRGMP